MIIIEALIIKYKINPSDEETILVIQENPYMQYFVGLSEFIDTPSSILVFPSLSANDWALRILMP